MIVLGIDPGSLHTGYGVIEVDGGQETLVAYGVLHLDAHRSHQWRLKQVYDRLTEVVAQTTPDECAVEMPVYGRNPQSMLKLGRVQAAAMLVALNHQIPVTQYTPKEVKKSVTGNGNAAKEQVWFMVKAILHIEEDVSLDTSDALAVALCHAHRRTDGGTATPHKNWAAFVQANPGRIEG